MTDDEGRWHPYRYTPSTLLAAIFLGLFGLTTLLHNFQLVRTRTWYLIPLLVGGVFEVIGFIGRLLSEKNDISVLGPYIVQAIFILIAPALFAASIYIVLGRIILMVDGERYSWVRQRHLTAAFVMGDVLSFQFQSNGGGLTAGSSPVLIRLGQILVIIGLFAQLLFFGLFIFVAGAFHYRLVHDRPVKKHLSFRYFRWLHKFEFWKRYRKAASERPSSSTYLVEVGGGLRVEMRELPWRRHMVVLYITSGLVFVRSVFRVAEYIQGEEGYLLSTEVYLYAFDAALMLVVMGLFNVVHPSQITKLAEQTARLGGEHDGILGVELQPATERDMNAIRADSIGRNRKDRS